MFTAWRQVGLLPHWLQGLLLGQLVSAVGSLAFTFLTLYLVQDRHLAADAAGLVGAAFGVGMIAGNLAGGSLGDRFGLRRGLLTATLAWAGVCAVLPLTPTTCLAALTAVGGFAAGAQRPLNMAVVLAAVAPEHRRTAAAVGRAAYNAGMVIGPPLGALAAAHDFGLVFVIDAASSALMAATIWRLVPSPAARPRRDSPGRTRGALWHTLRARPHVLWVLGTVIAVDVAYRQFYVALPLQLRALGLAPIAYGLLLAASCAVIVALEVPLSVRMAGHRALALVALGYGLVGLAWLVVGAVPSLVTAVLAVLVLTAGEMLYKPTATATVADAAPEGYAGRYQSLYASASVAGMFLAPALGGLGWAHAPRLVLPVAGAVALLAAAALAVHDRAAARRTGLFTSVTQV
jgi:MFS family permease